MAAQSTSIPLVSVLISTRDRRESLFRVLEAIREQDHHPIEVIVVDNDSSDGTVHALRSAFPEVLVIEAGANLGYARSINLASRKASGRFQLSIPDDVLLGKTYIPELLQVASMPDVAVAGGVIHEFPDTSRLNYVGATLSSILRLRILRDEIPSGLTETAYIPGGNFLIRRELYQEMGGFHESYTTYFEDLELCLRLRRRGMRLLVTPAARSYHISHGTSFSYHREFYGRRGIWLFFVRNASMPTLLGFGIYQTFWALPRDLLVAIWRRDARLLKAAAVANTWWMRHFGYLRSERRDARARYP